MNTCAIGVNIGLANLIQENFHSLHYDHSRLFRDWVNLLKVAGLHRSCLQTDDDGCLKR